MNLAININCDLFFYTGTLLLVFRDNEFCLTAELVYFIQLSLSIKIFKDFINEHYFDLVENYEIFRPKF